MITSGYQPSHLQNTANTTKDWMRKYLENDSGNQSTAPQPQPQPNLSYTAPEKQPTKVLEPEPKPEEKVTPKTESKSTKRFALRLTSKQRNQIKKLQKSWGLSTESAVIKKLIDDSKEEKNQNDLALQIKELTAVKAELNRIGININQIAKKSNQLQMSADDLNAVMQYMHDVCNIIYRKELKQ